MCLCVLISPVLIADAFISKVNVLVIEEAGRTLRRSDMDKLLELIEVLPSEGIIASEQPGLGQVTAKS
jgi:ABC-type sugar transport system ATPase subunit